MAARKVAYGTPDEVEYRLRMLEEELTLDSAISEVNFGSQLPMELQTNNLRLMMEEVVPKFAQPSG